jgi:three-Cys-motif partner protein
MASKGESYWQDEDGRWVEKVGPWAKEKQKILTDYVQIASATRKKYAHCSFIDVFSGPGKSQIRDSDELIDGSPVSGFKQGRISHPFSSVYISDADPDLLASAHSRLHELAAPVQAVAGPASVALPKIVNRLSSSGLHLALLDPHNLGTLSFDLFESLAKLRKIDIIVHVSLSDLQRNVDRYTSEAYAQFDRFAPDWRKNIRIDQNQASLRAAILKYWTEKVVALGLPRAKHCELIKGPGGQRLYWLMFLARHPLPHSFWNKINSSAKQPGFDFGDDLNGA